MKVTVVGGGRMGLPLACVFGKHGASVTVCDINTELADKIDRGECPYEEPGLPELMRHLHNTRRLSACANAMIAVSVADVVVVIVPAHLTPERDIDFSILQQASIQIGKGLRPNTLVIYETTVAVGGTRRNLTPLLEKYSGLKAGEAFFVAYSPERVKANLVLDRLENTPKVVGGLDPVSCAKAAAFYRQYLGAPVDDVGTLEAAEMTKLLGMLYRDVNIAFSNELAAYCERAGVDFERVRVAANTDGEANLLIPGIGVGGHCVPVYPYFLTREARRLGLPQLLSETAREINDNQPARQLKRIEAVWRPLKGEKAHILGLGFRPGVKVDTFSPAYALRDELERIGAQVTIEDPYYTDGELRRAGFEPGVSEAAGVVVLCTAHQQFANPNFRAWREAGVEVVLDGRNFWLPDACEAAGLHYLGIGRHARRANRPLPSLIGD
ncbi:nucleotide sugar dehydrogenase [Methylomicrobium agile]|uniref:nucleotide sugar dehydrogenase n=1 Tax=Methylomicrobium agile TaxID=39774 RepID=UPI0004DFB3D5|nr:nucleotide sugar dehydrogenase [Methylomicrobium agile]